MFPFLSNLFNNPQPHSISWISWHSAPTTQDLALIVSWYNNLQESIDLAKQFYFNRLPRLWNFLPPINLSNNYVTIVGYLKRILWDRFISTFDQFNTCTCHYCCPCAKCQVLTKHLCLLLCCVPGCQSNLAVPHAVPLCNHNLHSATIPTHIHVTTYLCTVKQ